MEVRVSEGEMDIRVVVAKEAQPDDSAKAIVTLAATASIEPTRKVKAALTRIANGSTEAEGLAEYGSTVSLQLSAAMLRVFELLRWRSNAAGPDHPYTFRTAEFSLDEGVTWARLPTQTRAELVKSGALRLDESVAQNIEDMAAGGAAEPVAHHLLREALEVASANPRSAIVIGVAAAETGFKHLVEILVPDAAWLVDKIATPPLVTMLREYLPTLPVRSDFGGKVFPPPKYARTLMTNAVQERNRVAHTGAAAMGRTELIETLGCVRDLLYLFDYYAGHEWAIDEVSEGFRNALGT